ncbi:hypothetical protein [Bremerella sp.]|uniref:hypothetical protein n=1 Tax=Bremerella sp. TaxID=2795602 RepID=UPI0039190992
MAISLALHIVVALLLSPGYYLFSTLLGLSSGYLAIVSIAVVRNRVATRLMYLAVIAMWAFWCLLSLWKNSMYSRIDALISTFFAIVIYCELCLGLAFYSKWQFTSKGFQFPLMQIFGLTAILAAVSFLWSLEPESASYTMITVGTILPAIAACLVLPVFESFLVLGLAMSGCLILVVGMYGIVLPVSGIVNSREWITSSELLVTSVSNCLLVTVGGIFLLRVEGDEVGPDPFITGRADQTESVADPFDEE